MNPHPFEILFQVSVNKGSLLILPIVVSGKRYSLNNAKNVVRYFTKNRCWWENKVIGWVSSLTYVK